MPKYIRDGSGILVPANVATRPAAPPELAEVATTIDGRDITRGYVDPMQLQIPQDSVLQLQGAGDYRTYREVLRDDQVASTLHQRRLAVNSREWQVQPGGERPIDKAAAEFIEDQVQRIGFDRVTDRMLYGLFYGYSVAEAIWVRDGSYIGLSAVKVRDRTRFGFDGVGRLRMKTYANMEGELLPERKFWAFSTGTDHDDEPYGLGLAHWLYWPVFFKRAGMRFWLIFLDRFGQPTAKGTYPANATPEEKSKLLRALSAVHTDSGIIVPDGMQVELIEAARSGTGDYTELYDRMDRAIAKVVLGQVASTEGTPGKLGNDDVQGDVRLDLVKADADLICESFNRTIVRWLCDWNFPGAAYPEVYRVVEDSEDLTAASERDKNLYEIGFKPSLKHVHDTYGGEYVEVPKSEPPAGGLGAPEFAARQDETDVVDQQLVTLQREGDAAISEMIGAIKKLVEEATSLEGLRDQLLDAFGGMDDSRLAQVMAEAITAASMAGRFDIVEQAGG